MLATFVHDGDFLDHIPAADLPVGAVVMIADAVGIAVRAIPAGSLGSLAMGGVFDLPRAPGALIQPGKRLFWDPAAQIATADGVVAGVVPLGIAAALSIDTAAVVRVRLNH